MVRLDQGGCAAEEIRLYPPPPHLRGWVRHVSVQPGPARRESWRVVPDTSGYLIFSMTAAAACCRLVGARSTYADVDVDRRLVTIAVRLQPGALPAVIGDRATALTDRAVDVADIFGARGRRLLNELPELTWRAAADRLIDAIAGRVEDRAAPELGRALARASRVEDLRRLLGSSARALHRRLVESAGLAPKRALRVERLHAALHRIGRGASLSAAALDAGYSDQAHFTRESRSLLGESPVAWRRRGRCGADSFKSAAPPAR